MHRFSPSVRLLVCLSVCRQKAKNAIFSKTKQFRAMVSIGDLRSRTWVFQRTHYWTHKIQDGGDPPSWILLYLKRRILFLVFLMQFGLRRAAAFVSSPIHLLKGARIILTWISRIETHKKNTLYQFFSICYLFYM